MIRLEGIEKVYWTSSIETIALDGIGLTVSPGESLAVMGPSGSGKSTLLNIIGLLDAPTRGKVLIDGREVTRFSDRAMARFRNEKIGFIFQSFHLINDLSVVDNVEIPLLYRRISGRTRRTLALEALEKVGLSSRTRHFPNQLSGGQMQRVAIARAIVGRPAIILADEPTGNLDSVMGDEIMAILSRLNIEEKATLIMVTHDERLAKQTERVVRLFDGHLVSEGVAVC